MRKARSLILLTEHAHWTNKMLPGWCKYGVCDSCWWCSAIVGEAVVVVPMPQIKSLVLHVFKSQYELLPLEIPSLILKWYQGFWFNVQTDANPFAYSLLFRPRVNACRAISISLEYPVHIMHSLWHHYPWHGQVPKYHCRNSMLTITVGRSGAKVRPKWFHPFQQWRAQPRKLEPGSQVHHCICT